MTTLQSTLEQQITSNMAAAELRSENPENKEPVIRIYETKSRRKLASGEIREYTLKQHYVVKKLPGPCKTEIKKREAKYRADITAHIRPFEASHLERILELCKQLNVTYSDEYLAAHP